MGLQALLLNIITIATTSALLLIAPCSSTSFTLQPLNLHPNFTLQSLYKPSQYPFVTPQEEIFLTQDPSDSGHTSRPLYNVGRITYNQSMQIKDASNQVLSFFTVFSFNITTTTKYNESGDGIAFVMTTDPKPPINSTGRFIGLMPEMLKDRHQQFMAVEFDSFQNLEAEILDPSASHIGIDISSLASVKVYDTADQSHPLYLYNNYTITAWVSYNASTHLIQVWATNSSHPDQRPLIPVLSSTQNLSRVFENHTNIYVGITAASGNNSQATILYSWNFTVVEDPPKRTSSPPLLSNRTSSSPLLKRTSSSPLPVLRILIPALVSAFTLTLAIAVAVIAFCRRKALALREQRSRAAIEDASVSVHRYRYNELRRATQNFSEERKIGRGGFSTVYKGILRDDTEVAIKKMKDGLVEADIIAREVQIISKIKHRNLLELEGWCYERGEALLVYKYMSKGSLDSYLYGEKRRCGEELDSKARFKIIVGVAAGLAYLHRGLDECILHRDVKAANVLLTEMLESKLGDFGLARLIAHDEIVTITAAGTIGYVAPEVVHTGRVTEKADVYSFGVLALEVACGRKAIDPYSSTYSRLVDWVWLLCQKSTIMDALDPSLMPDTMAMSALAEDPIRAAIENEELKKWACVLRLGLLCCQADPDMRPFMREVHQALKDCVVLPPPSSWSLYPAPSPRPNAEAVSTSTSELVEFFSLPHSS
ncbi:hypothetical protein L7F22_051783 [Adiantum nelumboides]|nr:hypothetical protein [Adiantum nelumboides]